MRLFDGTGREQAPRRHRQPPKQAPTSVALPPKHDSARVDIVGANDARAAGRGEDYWGALLFSAALPASEFSGPWPEGVPLQIHMMEADEWAMEDLPAARKLVETVGGAKLFLYPGNRHLFAANSLPDYDEEAAALLTERVLAFLKDHGFDASEGGLRPRARGVLGVRKVAERKGGPLPLAAFWEKAKSASVNPSGPPVRVMIARCGKPLDGQAKGESYA